MDQEIELKPKGFNSTTEKLAYQVYQDTIHHRQYWNQSRFSFTGREMQKTRTYSNGKHSAIKTLKSWLSHKSEIIRNYIRQSKDTWEREISHFPHLKKLILIFVHLWMRDGCGLWKKTTHDGKRRVKLGKK